jgi:hypothetical protein
MAPYRCGWRGRNLLLLALLCLSPPVVGAPAPALQPAAPSPSALLVSAINQPHVVRGDDGRDHVEYDLMMINAFGGPITISSVEVVGPNGAVLGRIDGATLAAATQGVLLQTPVNSIPPSGAASVEIDLALKPGQVPQHLSHRIAYATPDAPPHLRALVGSDVVQGPELAVSQFRAIAILPPLKGAGWAAFNGCCTPNAHRNVRVSAGTRIGTAETFAIDFLRVDGDRFYSGDGKSDDQYSYFGAPVYAVAAGVVVATHDGMAETVPFGEPTTVERPADFGGNYVMIRQEQGIYAFYAHLKTGSVAVKPGQQIAAGTVLGGVGNSGNSTNPHLHFGLLDRPDFMTGISLPFVFGRYALTGHITDGHDDGTLVIKADARAVEDAYPLVGAIATYR